MVNIAQQSMIKGSSEIDGEDKVQKEYNVSKNQYKVGPQFIYEAMDPSEINNVIEGVRPKVIVLIGFPNYGKTTFVGTIFGNLLSEGEFCDQTFIDSDTFSGFERRFYLRRIPNEYNEEEINSLTKRTILGENSLLTLKLENKCGEMQKIVISDNSGELYKKIRNGGPTQKEEKIIHNADLLVFFIDSEKLVDDEITVFNDYRTLLIRLKMHGAPLNEMDYIIVFNKYDKIENNNKNKIEEFSKNIIDIFSQECKREGHYYNISSLNYQNEDYSIKEVFKYICNVNKTNKSDYSIIDWVSKKIRKDGRS